MEEQLASTRSTELARELGFVYRRAVNLYGSKDGIIESFKDVVPTQSLLQKWLRETYDVQIFTMTDLHRIPRTFYSKVYVKGATEVWIGCENRETYELSLEDALLFALIFLKKKVV